MHANAKEEVTNDYLRIIPYVRITGVNNMINKSEYITFDSYS